MTSVLSLEDRRRLDWSRRLSDVLWDNGYRADDVFDLDAGMWQWAASLAKVELPTDAIQLLIWKRLTERERLERAFPLEGLPQ